ncbi:IS66-like element accessory protein TnpA [Mesorhizobium ciceri]|uniref:IS66-like element accessory protein TnpA n=3 Tax=Phyllobacteriaceae TaxID=69277 RepID=UPI00067F4B57|nr:transposase [Mesorhizobium ciceri]
MKYLAMEQPSTLEASTAAAVPQPPDAGRQRTRRSWTVEQKLAIVREVQESGDPVSVVARRHDMNANHLFIWMKQAQEGRLGRSNPPSETPPIAFIDMGVVGPSLHDAEPEEPAPERSHSEVPATTRQAVSTGGRMEIVGANGRRVIVDRTVDVGVLMRILQGLEMLR